MTKTVVEILRTWGRYVKGDIAGFEPNQARRLFDAKPPIAKPFDGEIRKPARDNSGTAADAALAKRAAELDAREKQLAAREAALDETAGRAAADEGAAKKPAGEAVGQPPKQGGK